MEVNASPETEQEDRETIRAPELNSIVESPPFLNPEGLVPPRTTRRRTKSPQEYEGDVGEVVFFEYGVVVFFGLQERYERDIIEDIDRAGILKRPIAEKDWEIEECHFIVCTEQLLIPNTDIIHVFQHDPHIAYPRIYNDFFSMYANLYSWTPTDPPPA